MAQSKTRHLLLEMNISSLFVSSQVELVIKPAKHRA